MDRNMVSLKTQPFNNCIKYFTTTELFKTYNYKILRAKEGKNYIRQNRRCYCSNVAVLVANLLRRTLNLNTLVHTTIKRYRIELLKIFDVILKSRLLFHRDSNFFHQNEQSNTTHGPNVNDYREVSPTKRKHRHIIPFLGV